MPSSHSSKAALAAAIRNVPDFPEPGIQFKDITPLLADASLFRQSVDLLIGDHPPGSIDAVVFSLWMCYGTWLLLPTWTQWIAA